MNATLNATNMTSAPPIVMETAKDFILELPNAAIRGEIWAIIISLILLFISLIIINRLSTVLLAVLKRSIVFIIVVLIGYEFIPGYIQTVLQDGFTLSLIFTGISAFILLGAGLFIASRSLLRGIKHQFKPNVVDGNKKKSLTKGEGAKFSDDHPDALTTDDVKTIFKKEQLKSDKSLLMILVYLIVAEFGVFTSPTLSAPNTQSGIMLFTIFLVGISLFVTKAYKSIKVGFLYLFTTLLVGVGFAFALGIIWGDIPMLTLLSPDFFTSDSLIALISGMSVSLFAGSRG